MATILGWTMRDAEQAQSVADAWKLKEAKLKHQFHQIFHPYCPLCNGELAQANKELLGR